MAVPDRVSVPTGSSSTPAVPRRGSRIRQGFRFATRSLTRLLTTDPRWRAFVLQRLGDLHLAAGDTVRAVERYTEFVRLWEHADDELQPRVRAVQSKLAKLRGPG